MSPGSLYSVGVKLANAGMPDPGVAQVGHWVWSTYQLVPVYVGPFTPGTGTGSLPL